jgi:DNA topoisomerase-1
VNDLLVDNFPDILDVDFTAGFENNLDRVEIGELSYLDVLRSFYDQFSKNLEWAKENMLSIKGVGFPTNLNCPQCEQKKLHIKVGKNGPFLACSGYPDCSYSRNFTRDETGSIHPVEPSFELAEGKFCEKCKKPMVLKQGRYGEFLACSGYPDCKNTQSVNGTTSGKSTGVKCPEPDCDGELTERKSKRGKVFYGCSRYPDCSFATWDRPVDQECPQCGTKYLLEKITKKQGTFLKCPNPDCGYKESK